MKNQLLKQLITIFLFLFTTGVFSINVHAHFGSKGPFGGAISCGTASASTVYLGTSQGGVFESTTTGLTAWRARPVGLKSGKISALSYTGSYLFAGTADSGVFIFNGYSGSDRYWIKVNNGLTNLKIKSLVAIDTITLLAGTEGGGIFRTTNKGVSWQHVNNGNLNNAVVTSLVKAGNSRIILASQSGGLFVSDDKGITWSDFNDANTLNIAGTNTLSYNATTDELLILNNNGLFKTENILAASTPSFSLAQSGLGAATIHSISNNGTDWYLATNTGVYTTATGIINWTSANAGLTGAALDVKVVVPFQTSLIAGTDKEGVFKTSSATTNWVANNLNFNNTTTYSMTSKDSMLVVAATDKGIFVSKDLAANYARANTGLTDSLNVTDLVFSGTNLFAATRNNGVFASTDTGKTWTTYALGLANLDIRKMAASETHLYVICSNGKVYQSTGLGWSSIQSGLPSGVIPTSFAFYNGIVLLGTLGDGIFTRSETSGSWVASNTGLSNLNVTSVTTSGSKLFAGTDGSGVFISDLLPVQWSAVSNLSVTHTSLMGLDGSKVQAMAYNKGYIYASYKGGLLATSDNGATWIPAGNQFNLPSFTDVTKISFVTSRVFVTSENNGLYSNALTELPEVIVTGLINQKNELSATSIAVSPNPNNGNFILTMDSEVELDLSEIIIFNSFGMVMNRFETYQKEISVKYPNGIYYVQIRTSKGNLTKKMIVE